MSRILRRFFSLPWTGHSGPTKRPTGAQLRPFCIQESVHLQPRHADGLPAREHASPTRRASSPSATANMMRHYNLLMAIPCAPTPNCPLLATPPSHEDDLPSQMDARHLLYWHRSQIGVRKARGFFKLRQVRPLCILSKSTYEPMHTTQCCRPRV